MLARTALQNCIAPARGLTGECAPLQAEYNTSRLALQEKSVEFEEAEAELGEAQVAQDIATSKLENAEQHFKNASAIIENGF
jgi:hypothetical protein